MNSVAAMAPRFRLFGLRGAPSCGPGGLWFFTGPTVETFGISFAFPVTRSLTDGKVSMPLLDFDSTESFQVDGTPYTIAVYRTPARFVGYWQCFSCPRHRMKTQSCGTQAAGKKR